MDRLALFFGFDMTDGAGGKDLVIFMSNESQE
jgi:hypothetical protein